MSKYCFVSASKCMCVNVYVSVHRQIQISMHHIYNFVDTITSGIVKPYLLC